MTIPSRIEIPPFPHGKRIAVTTSFDDGQTYDRKVVAAFNAWGLKGTFNLNSSKLQRTGKPASDGDIYLDACEVEDLYRGHEVAIHTVTHPIMDRLDPSQIAYEVLDDRRALEDLVGYPVRGMAYPFGNYNAKVMEILRHLGIAYSRTCENADPCFPPRDPLAWASTAHQFASDPGVPERFEKLLDRPRYHGVFSIWGHSYEFHQKNDWDALERIFKPLSGHSEAWYCTNIELFDYEAARRRMVIAANRRSAYNPSGIAVGVVLDQTLIDIPPGKTVVFADSQETFRGGLRPKTAATGAKIWERDDVEVVERPQMILKRQQNESSRRIRSAGVAGAEFSARRQWVYLGGNDAPQDTRPIFR